MFEGFLSVVVVFVLLFPVVNWLFLQEPVAGQKHDDEIDARLGRGSVIDDWPTNYMDRWWAQGWLRRRRHGNGNGAPKARLL
ncbi:MAG: hypothetical protein ACRD0G_05270 [Acidimicrobiales bacterium]